MARSAAGAAAAKTDYLFQPATRPSEDIGYAPSAICYPKRKLKLCPGPSKEAHYVKKFQGHKCQFDEDHLKPYSNGQVHVPYRHIESVFHWYTFAAGHMDPRAITHINMTIPWYFMAGVIVSLTFYITRRKRKDFQVLNQGSINMGIGFKENLGY